MESRIPSARTGTTSWYQPNRDVHVPLPPPFEFDSQHNPQRYYRDGSEDPYRVCYQPHVPDNAIRGERDYDPDDTDSENDTHYQHYEPPFESSDPRPTGVPRFTTSRVRSAYPAWSTERQVPLFKEEIEDIFVDLTQQLGFQRDSMRNMFDFTMQLLDSRASRMSPNQALLTLHADYIGGKNANYFKWYLAAQLDLDDAVGQTQNHGPRRSGPPKAGRNSDNSLGEAIERWRQDMNNLSQHERMRQIALYLLCWGEAAQVRFVPECLCFIFKCSDDYYQSPECQSRVQPVREGLYMRNVIKPLYRFIRDQGYEVVDGRFVRREEDHAGIIGYDDINQLFWDPEGIARITLDDDTRLVDLPPSQRYMNFDRIQWSRTFFKTHYERRTFGQWLVNFNRIWIIHVPVYWFYMAYNSPKIYDNNHSTPMRWSVTALGGGVTAVLMISATIVEFFCIPITRDNTSYLARRLFFLLIALALTVGPTIYVATKGTQTQNQRTPLLLGIAQFFIAVAITLVFAAAPSGRTFGDRVAGKPRKYFARQSFTTSYPSMTIKQRLPSFFLWFLIFGCKFAGSYFFLTLSFRQSIDTMVGLKVKGCHDKHFGDGLCDNQVIFTLAMMYIMGLVLFFLDTFLWWIIWSTIFTVARSFYLGLFTWVSWRAIYSLLPTRIYSQFLATSCPDVEYESKDLVSQIWNAIILSMYRDHLLSVDNLQNLLYHQVATDDGQPQLRTPPFFNPRLDPGLKCKDFPRNGEAERRISFFARSLSTAMPKSISVEAMPGFTVLIPHYSEKILLSLREIIREEDQNARITLLEYLKQLHSVEWDNFVVDTKIFAQESALDSESHSPVNDTNDLPFYSIGFRSASPEFTLRTRIWSSLRSQTLYRTVSGMMNYAKAIKLLYRVENPEVVRNFCTPEELDRELEWVGRRKFKFIVAMQRYSKFNREESENAEFLLRAYPDLQIAYLEEEPARNEGGEPRLLSALIDGHCEFDVLTGRRRPKFRIELPGNPILGDGKSDNQNHAIIFYRGEYIQLVDANQENYLEECLKIRSVLGEFEEYEVSDQSPYADWGHDDLRKTPVAIVGASEYIFSEKIGVLGDLAAAKQETFGTFTARLLSWLGGKLHYGHPDFLNAIYMTTRGGISKAQKGLHLNEDIFAGMNAFGRGGRIKHAEYYRCGKGRDLGFGTILNFMTKMGSGMGEQTLSREYYYLGTQLPIDRFLTFYYAHPGPQINNILITLSVQVFIITMVFMGTLNSALACGFNDDSQPPNEADSCHFLIPAFDWITRCIIAIFLVFVIGFLPPFFHEIVERGLGKALLRLGKQVLSFSPLFEVFATRISSYSMTRNLVLGGARYIATGRGFATTRISFNILFSRFAGPSIYLGVRNTLMLLYVTMTFWTPWLVYFWLWTLALCISPFLFNPHQFVFVDFFVDYREFLRWMMRGNSPSHYSSWIGYCRLSRTIITGYKRKRLGHPSEKLSGDVPRAPRRAIFFSEVVWPIAIATIFTVAYLFIKSFPDHNGNQPPKGSLTRIVVISVGPIVWNAGVLAIQFLVSLALGPSLDPTFPGFGSTVAFITHILGLVGTIGSFELLWYLELWDTSHAVLGLIVAISIQRAIYKVASVLLNREFKHDETNKAWWTGRWYGRNLGYHVLSQPPRELIVKISELSLWSSDFLIGHMLMFMLAPPILIPYFDKLHSMLLFWLRPSDRFRAPLFTTKQKQQRRRIVIKYGITFVLVAGVFAVLLAMPLILPEVTVSDCNICRML